MVFDLGHPRNRIESLDSSMGLGGLGKFAELAAEKKMAIENSKIRFDIETR